MINKLFLRMSVKNHVQLSILVFGSSDLYEKKLSKLEENVKQ